MSDSWDAAAYHRLSNPQLAWGEHVLERLELAGDETVLDAGCGTGRLTTKLLERLPRGRVIAVDSSAEMLAAAAKELAPWGDRVELVRCDRAALDLADVADVVFSTATLHWVLDHARLFANLYRALRDGGRLLAQCGGGPNLRGLMERVHAVQARPPFAEHFAGHEDPWEFADAATTAARLHAAGFASVETNLVAAPTIFEDERIYWEFLRTAILRLQLEQLPEALRSRFLDEVVARVPRPLVLDYWRLNLSGRKILTAKAT